MVDEAGLHEFIGKMLGDPGASSVAMAGIGDALGLYRTLRAVGPTTCAALA